MCSICHSYPCNPRCPNAPDPPKVYTCEQCNDGICEGEEYVMIHDKYYHRECFEEEWEDILWREGVAKAGTAEVDYDDDRY